MLASATHYDSAVGIGCLLAKTPRGGRRYFNDRFEPMIDGQRVRLTGEVNDPTKLGVSDECNCVVVSDRLARAFGLVMIEAMACGTPVIAFRHGSVPEVIEDGVDRR